MAQKTDRMAAVLIRSTALVAPGLCLAILGAPTLAAAQTSPTQSSASTQVEEVVVTGTLFRTKVETAAPVTVLTDKSIAKAGITTVADAIRSIAADNSGTLPPAFPGAFAFGASGVALRGLTVNSTLVLTDGLRNADYPIGDDGVRSFVDLNTLPLAVVDHIDVLKDGASSLYGADAIGGVVNIILKPTFQGVEGTVEGGWTQHGGDANEHVDLTVGQGDLDKDRYNVYVSLEYQHNDPIEVSQRGFPFNTTNLTGLGGPDGEGAVNNGQPQLNSGSIYGSVTPATMLTPGNITTGQALPGALSQILSPTGCGPEGKASVDNLGNKYCYQNLIAPEYDYPRETRAGVYARFTTQFNPQNVGYISFSYYQNQVYQPQYAPQIQSGTPNNTNSIVLPATLPGGGLNPNDPFAAAGEAALINFAFPNIPSYFQTTDNAYRLVGDLKGNAGGWDYEAGVALEYESLDYAQAGFLDYPALIADVTDGAYNFINPSATPKAVLNALGPVVTKTSTSNLDSIDLHATHALYALPGGDLRVGLGVHAHYEDEYNPELNGAGLYQNIGVDHAIGHRNVESLFAEIDAPVFKSLDLNVSGRFDHYSDFGSAFSPKATIKWTPIKQIALRATASQGFRAPSFAESGNAAVGGFVNYTPATDPNAPASFLAAHGNNSYVTNSYALEEVNIANPHIKPEKSTSFTVGFVVQPVKYISASVDYYYISKTDMIAPGSQGPVLADYYAGLPLPAGDTVLADKADPNNPNALARPLVIGTEYTNANSLITDGIDVEIRGNFDLPYDAKLTSDFDWTDIFRYAYSTPGLPTYNYVGTESPYNLSSGAGTPQYRADWSTTLSRGPASITATVNYVSGMLENAADLGAPGCIAPTAPRYCKVAAFTDVDMNLDYKITSKIDLFFNVYNLFDAPPPIDLINYAGINYNPTYAEAGIIGRAFKVGVHVKY